MGADPKQRLRREMESRRRAVAPGEALAAARAVARLLLREPRLRGARRVALYASVGAELPTRPLFDALAELGRPRLLPRVRGDRLEWAETGEWERLSPGRWGLPEPGGPAADPPGAGDVALLPGLAFDARGGRLGRGGGYYDRAFAAGGATPVLIGVGYRFQCVEEVPCDGRDRRLDAIVHEEGLVWVREEA